MKVVSRGSGNTAQSRFVQGIAVDGDINHVIIRAIILARDLPEGVPLAPPAPRAVGDVNGILIDEQHFEKGLISRLDMDLLNSGTVDSEKFILTRIRRLEPKDGKVVVFFHLVRRGAEPKIEEQPFRLCLKRVLATRWCHMKIFQNPEIRDAEGKLVADANITVNVTGAWMGNQSKETRTFRFIRSMSTSDTPVKSSADAIPVGQMAAVLLRPRAEKAVEPPASTPE